MHVTVRPIPELPEEFARMFEAAAIATAATTPSAEPHSKLPIR